MARGDMMKTFIQSLTIAAFGLVFPLSLRADIIVPADEVEFEPHITGDGEKMNYGPFLSYSLFGVGKEGKGKINLGLLRDKKPPVFLRPINIHLGGKHWACFDTEMCAFGCSWSGGPPNISRSNLNGYKGADLAYLRLPAIFQNQVRPGWSLDSDFKDPRPTQHGALPKNIAHYQGLFLAAGKVTLFYRVAGVNVFDMPYMVGDRPDIFARAFEIGPTKRRLWFFVAELPGAKAAPAKNAVDLRRDGASLSIAVASENAVLRVQEQARAVVEIPPSRFSTFLVVLISRHHESKQLLDQLDREGHPWRNVGIIHQKPPNWKETITLSGQLGNNDAAYTVDTIPLPFKNPWNSWMRPSGFDFFSDGRAALCTWNGDVWIVSGLDDDLKKVTWKRYATGLFEPMGLKIVDEKVYVCGKDQITRLHDLNGDGEADFYENFNNDAPTAASYHSFALELHTDKDGNFYYLRGAHRIPPGTPMHGGLIKVAKDGSKAELLCTGIREANGMAIGPDGTITVADNQGNWVPSSKIDIIRPGKFYGYRWEKDKNYPTPENPLCWIPMKEDNSSGGQVWVTSEKWGPLKGDLLHTSYGTAKLFQVFLQRDGDKFQGGVSPFPLEFNAGIMRARFHPKDGQLYLCGLKGWSTAGKHDGGFYRVRYTGKPVYRPKSLRVDKGKITVSFTDQLDAASVKVANIKVEQWNYRWTAAYGSKDYSVADPKKEGRDAVEVKAVRLTEDRKTVVLEIPDVRPVMQMGIQLKLRAANGCLVKTTIFNTVNYLP